MANNIVNLTTLDFPSIKANLKNYLQSNSVFKDYNFDSSNLNVLLDILSYNTYLQSYYLNMIATEMFLDSAQLDSSIISHAKELNYTPRSKRSASATITLTYPIQESDVYSLTVPKGLQFTGTNGSNVHTYTVAQNETITSSNSTFSANITIYEGSWFSETFVYNANDDAQRFIIQDENIDTTSITVTSIEDNNSTEIDYIKADSLLNATANSKIYFLQATENQRYEIVFGDDVLGRKPKDQSTIFITFRSTEGAAGDNCTDFILSQDLAEFNGKSQGTLADGSVNFVTTLAASAGGADKESHRSIKYNAPRHYQTQGRAVTASDFKNLIIQNYPNVYDASVYGGETVTDTVEYGKVYISLNGYNNRILSNIEKQEIVDFLKTKSILGIEPVAINANEIFAVITSDVYVDYTSTSKNYTQLKNAVITGITTYNNDSLELFNNTLRYSKLIEAIDDSDTSILSNSTNLLIRKKHVPTLNTLESITLDFNNAIQAGTFTSTNFVSLGKNYKLVDKVTGITNNNRYVYKLEVNVDNTNPIYSVIGNIDYNKGIVTIGEIEISAYTGTSIKFDATPNVKDLKGSRNNIIQIDLDEININMVDGNK